MFRNEKERKLRKERRKSEKYSWQFVDLNVNEIKKEMIYLNIAGCSNFEILNDENIWNYKLMCCVVDEDPDKWICVDKGRYRVDLDCIIPPNTSVEIKSFNSMIKSKNKYLKFHRNVWIFKSLILKENSTLEIKPFGYNFIGTNNKNKEEKQPHHDDDFYDDYYDEHELKEIGDNKDFQFGSIRIFAYDKIIIEKGAQ
eukprot:251631_1